MSDNLSISSLIMNADVVVQVVMVLLLTASVFSWGIMFEKWHILKKQIRHANMFEEYFESLRTIDNVDDNLKKQRNSTVVKILKSGLIKFQTLHNESVNSLIAEDHRSQVSRAMWNEYQRFMNKIERNTDLLATIGSTAPFIGLLGTVWGIMHSFQSIALTKNTTLEIVAPSIAEALLATAAGLLVAIPAVIFYNRILVKIQQFSEKVTGCIIQLEDILFQAKGNV